MAYALEWKKCKGKGLLHEMPQAFCSPKSVAIASVHSLEKLSGPTISDPEIPWEHIV